MVKIDFKKSIFENWKYLWYVNLKKPINFPVEIMNINFAYKIDNFVPKS